MDCVEDSIAPSSHRREGGSADDCEGKDAKYAAENVGFFELGAEKISLYVEVEV